MCSLPRGIWNWMGLFKVLETDIQTYQGIVTGLGKEAQRLFKIGCQDPATLRKAQVTL